MRGGWGGGWGGGGGGGVWGVEIRSGGGGGGGSRGGVGGDLELGSPVRLLLKIVEP